MYYVIEDDMELAKVRNRFKEHRFSLDETKNKRRRDAILEVSEETFQKMIKRYKDDFEIFNIPIPTFSQFRGEFSKGE